MTEQIKKLNSLQKISEEKKQKKVKDKKSVGISVMTSHQSVNQSGQMNHCVG